MTPVEKVLLGWPRCWWCGEFFEWTGKPHDADCPPCLQSYTLRPDEWEKWRKMVEPGDMGTGN